MPKTKTRRTPGFGAGTNAARMSNPRRVKIGEEIGGTGLAQYGGYITDDFERVLQGTRGLQKLRELSMSHPICAAGIFAYRTMLLAPKLRVEPAGEKPGDLAAAQHVEECMGDMYETFETFRSEATSYLTYGFAWHELVFKRRLGQQPEEFVSTSDGSFARPPNYRPSSRYDDGRIGWHKFAPRSQEAMTRWALTPQGELVGMYHAPAPTFSEQLLPLAKSLHFVTNQMRGNPEGISILRPTYRQARLSNQAETAEAIGLARNLQGYPVLHAPEDLDLFDEGDPKMVSLLADAKELVTGIKRDEQEGAVLPFGWDLQLLSVSGSLDTSPIIDRYHTRIAMCMLMQFLLLGMDRGGAYELAKQQESFWLRAVKGHLAADLAVLNRQAIPLLIDLNDFGELSGYPTLQAEDVTEPELAQIADYAGKLAQQGLLTPSPETEEHLRERASLPDLEEDFVQEPMAAQPAPEPTEPAGNEGEGAEGEPKEPAFRKDHHYSLHDVLAKGDRVRDLIEHELDHPEPEEK
jgi:hypothetical protein